MVTITEVFGIIVELAESMGVQDINQEAACWEVDIDSHWSISVNGHREAVTCVHGVNVAPFTAYLQYNGWPAGMITPLSGLIAAGNAVNEQSFIDACKVRILKELSS